MSEFETEFSEGFLIIRGNGGNRAISPEELGELVETDDPMIIR
jgi:hypothetical protein